QVAAWGDARASGGLAERVLGLLGRLLSRRFSRFSHIPIFSQLLTLGASMRRPLPVKGKMWGSQGACPLAEYEAAPHARVARRPPGYAGYRPPGRRPPFPHLSGIFRTVASCQGRAVSARLANP